MRHFRAVALVLCIPIAVSCGAPASLPNEPAARFTRECAFPMSLETVVIQCKEMQTQAMYGLDFTSHQVGEATHEIMPL
jgi:hypothetical protein